MSPKLNKYGEELQNENIMCSRDFELTKKNSDSSFLALPLIIFIIILIMYI